MNELEKKQQELAEVVTAFKAAQEKAFATKSAEYQAKADELNNKISDVEKQMNEVKAAMARGSQGNGGGADQNEEKKMAHKKAVEAYMRKGFESAELKTMSVGSDEDGGYLVTPEMSSEVVKKIYESSPIRQLASVQVISTDALEILEDLDEIQSGWVAEQQPRGNTTTAKLKMVKIPTHELYAQPLATQKLLDDASINIESWLAGKVAEKFARDENTAFVSGDGVGKARGFLSYADGTGFDQVEQVAASTSLTIKADDLIDLEYSLKGEYKKNGSWLAKRQVIKEFRKFKDTQGRYLWEPGLNGAAQATLLGHPVYEANDMQANGVAGNLPVAFGDFKAGYQIVDRIGIRVIRDVYSNKPFVLFYTTKRVGGAVKNFEAIKLLKVIA